MATTESLKTWQSNTFSSPEGFSHSVIKTEDNKNYLIYGVEGGYSIGIDILDVSNPDNPIEISYLKSSVIGNESQNKIEGLKLSGPISYIATTDYLWIIDVEDIRNPREIQVLSSFAAYGLDISGKYGFIISKNDNKIVIALDILNAANPQSIGKISFPQVITKINICQSLLLAMSPAGLNTGGGLHIIDISAPNNLKEISFLPDLFTQPTIIPPEWIPPSFFDIATKDKYVYILSGVNKLLIVDLVNPAAPKLMTTFDTSKQGINILIGDDIAYVLSSNGPVSFSQGLSDSISEIKISNPNKPEELNGIKLSPSSKFSTSSYGSITKVERDLYLTLGSTPEIEIARLDSFPTN